MSEYKDYTVREKLDAMLAGAHLKFSNGDIAYMNVIDENGPFVLSPAKAIRTYPLGPSWKKPCQIIKPPAPKKKRPMTRNEMLNWAVSKDSEGWVVKYSAGDWGGPQSQKYVGGPSDYLRARMTPTGPVDVQGFEIEE